MTFLMMAVAVAMATFLSFVSRSPPVGRVVSRHHVLLDPLCVNAPSDRYGHTATTAQG